MFQKWFRIWHIFIQEPLSRGNIWLTLGKGHLSSKGGWDFLEKNCFLTGDKKKYNVVNEIKKAPLPWISNGPSVTESRSQKDQDQAHHSINNIDDFHHYACRWCHSKSFFTLTINHSNCF